MDDAIIKKRGKGVSYYAAITLLYFVLIVLVFAFGIPFFWLISSSLKSNSELYALPVVWIPKIPQLSNYVEAVTAFPFLKYLCNTLLIVVCNVAGSVISCTLIAYGFARIKWRGRNILFLVVLMTMMIPFQVIMIPQLMVFRGLNWVGTFLPLAVPPFLGNAFFIFLLRQFMISLPDEISEAARIDGANEFQIYAKVCLPLIKPAITTVGIFAFLNSWNDFIGPLIFLSDEKLYTLSIGIQQIMSINDPRWNLLMAIGVLMTLPVLLIFALLQKYFIQGISFVGIKG